MFFFVEITCSAPATPDAGGEPLPVDVADGLDYLESYTYSCMEGYTTTDDLCTVCQPDGTLSLTTAPTCTSEFIFVYFSILSIWFDSIIYRIDCFQFDLSGAIENFLEIKLTNMFL